MPAESSTPTCPPRALWPRRGATGKGLGGAVSCTEFAPDRQCAAERIQRRTLWRFVAMGLLTAIVGCGDGVKKDDGTVRIAVIPKGTTHDFWQAIHAGAAKAEGETTGVTIVFRGPEREDDRAAQIALVENFISSDIDAIVLAPLDDQALLEPVKLATGRKIPVVVIDSGLKGEVGKDFVSFVATDNRKGGVIAGERLGSLIGGQGKVLMLRYQEGSASTVEREAGFVAAMSEFKGVEFIDPKRYAGATRETAQIAAENLLDTHKDLAGIFCSNESATFGMLLALRSRRLTGKVSFVGFDASPGLVDAMAKDEINGLVVQDPFKMGYLGVKTALAALKGQPVEPAVDTGVALVTKASMTTPEHHALLHPDLESYLKGR